MTMNNRAILPIVTKLTMQVYFKDRSALQDKVEMIVKEMDMEYLWQWFLSNNKAASLYYHNNYHAMWMVNNCFEMSQHYGHIPEEQIRYLLIAALLHDLNHSGGVYDDAVNISVAINGVRSLVPLTLLTPTGCEIVSDLIRVTEYPFKHEPLNLCQQILRDSDIMQGMTPLFNKIIYHDLYCELLVSKPNMNYESFLLGQKHFHEMSVMFTEIGKKHKETFLTTYGGAFMDMLRGEVGNDAI